MSIARTKNLHLFRLLGSYEITIFHTLYLAITFYPNKAKLGYLQPTSIYQHLKIISFIFRVITVKCDAGPKWIELDDLPLPFKTMKIITSVQSLRDS